MLKKIYVLFAGLSLLCGCMESKLIGTWLQPVPGIENQQQGIIFYKDGSASSVNMRTLVYESWKQDGDILQLRGKSIGNGQTFEIEEEFIIRQLDGRHLVLQLGDMVVTYTRK